MYHIDLNSKDEVIQSQHVLDEHVIVSVANAQGIITYVNDKFCEITGYSREELLGQNHRILKSAEQKPEFYQQMWQTISSGKTWFGELCNYQKTVILIG